MPNGVVIVVSGDDKTGEVFNAINRHLAETRQAAEQTAQSFHRIGGEAVPQFAAASAAVRAFEGSLSVRATERFLTGVLGLGPALMAAFPVIGALAFIDVIGEGIKRVVDFAGEVSNISTELNTGWLEAAIGKFAGVGEAVKQADEEMQNLARSIDEARGASTNLDIEFVDLTKGHVEGLRAQQQQIEKNIESQKKALAIERESYAQNLAASKVKSRVVVSGGEGGQGSVQEYEGPDALKARAAAMTDEAQIRDSIAKIDQLERESRNKGIEIDQAAQEEQKRRADDAQHAASKIAAAEKQIEAAQEKAAASRVQLADAVAKVDSARAQSDAEMQLALLDSMHKQQLISDATYYAQKGAVQAAAFESEHSAIQAQQLALMDQIDAVEARKPKTAKDRLDQEAQLNSLHKEELDLDAKLLELDGKRAQKSAELDTARTESLQRQRDQIAQMEAELERAAGGTRANKGIDESRVKSGEERVKLANGGATPQELAEFDALEKLKEAKLQIQALDRQGEVIKRSAELAEAKVAQAELSHALSQHDAERQLDAIRANELAQLKALSNAYAQYGEAGMEAEAKVQQQITQTMQTMQKEGQEINQSVQQIAHSIFDPLFDMGEKWQKKWQSISKGLERDLGQFAEKQLFGALFGDEATGGHGRGGGGIGGKRGGLGGVDGLLGGVIGTLFGKKAAGPTSNGGLGGGAGTIPDAAASLLQIGKGAGGAGGIQVVLNNQGPPMQVDQSSQSMGDGGESQVIQIMLKQLETNGAVAQGISALINH